MPTTAVEALSFKLTSDTGAVARRLDEWSADYPLNVKSFGAVGNGSHNDTTNIQSCFDAAFGTSGLPHGTSSSLNRPVYFPPGQYECGDLVLTQVKDGLIYGDGQSACILHYNGSSGKILRTQGFEQSTIRGIGFGGPGATSAIIGLDLDWDNTGSVGLKNNIITQVGGSSLFTCLRIGEQGHEGYGNYLLQLAITACTYGIKIKSTGSNTLVNTFPFDCDAGNFVRGTGTVAPSGSYGYGLWCVAGDVVHLSAGAAGGQTDVLWASPGSYVALGGRSESYNFLEISNGRANIIGHTHDIDPAMDWSPAGYMRTIKMTSSNATVLYDASSAQPYGVIEGNGTLYIRGGSKFASSTYLANFTGQIREMVNDTPLTMATLPLAAEGCEVNVSNAPVTAWGVTPSGTGSVHAKLRYNGSAWTMVGK